jgi:hypothetical protein
MSKGVPLLHSCAVADSSASIPMRDALFYRHPLLRSSTLNTCRAEFFSRLLSAHHITRQDTYQRPSRMRRGRAHGIKRMFSFNSVDISLNLKLRLR